MRDVTYRMHQIGIRSSYTKHCREVVDVLMYS